MAGSRSEPTSVEELAEKQPSVCVTVRLRPLVERELKRGEQVGWEYSSNAVRLKGGSGAKTFTFDGVMPPDTDNQTLYRKVGKNIVTLAMEGYNGTIFAYGQTGSGKTWSMMGDNDLKYPGVIPQGIDDVFRYIESHSDRKTFLLRCSYMEVYNEQINDLLHELNDDGSTSDSSSSSSHRDSHMEVGASFSEGKAPGKDLDIKIDDPIKGAIIKGLHEMIIGSREQAMDFIHKGEQSRHVAGTNMNARSSRSHTIFRIVIESKLTEKAAREEAERLAAFEDDTDRSNTFTAVVGKDSSKDHSNTHVSYLNFVDLAGSERQRDTGTAGQRLKEGSMINKSLLALGEVIHKLTEIKTPRSAGIPVSGGSFKMKKKQVTETTRLHSTLCINVVEQQIHIPYRNSKLTRILKQSLGGNTFTSILIAMTPAPMHKEESITSLKFGEMCKKIQNRARKNVVHDDKALLKQYKLEILKLREQLSSEAHDSTSDGTKKGKGGDSDQKETTEKEVPAELVASLKEKESEVDSMKEKLHFLQNLVLGAGTTGGQKVVGKSLQWLENIRGANGAAVGLAKGRHRRTNTVASTSRRLSENMLVSVTNCEPTSLRMRSGSKDRSAVMNAVSNMVSRAHRARSKVQTRKRRMSMAIRQIHPSLPDDNALGKASALELMEAFHKAAHKKAVEHREEVTNLKKDIAWQKEQVEAANEEKEALESECEQLHSHMDELEARVLEKEEELNHLTHDLGVAKNRVVEMERSSEELVAQLTKERSSATDEKKQAAAEKGVLSGRLRQAISERESLQSMYNLLEERVQEIQKRVLRKTGYTLDQVAVEIENQVDKFQAERETLQARESAVLKKEKEVERARLQLIAQQDVLQKQTDEVDKKIKDVESRESNIRMWNEYHKKKDEKMKKTIEEMTIQRVENERVSDALTKQKVDVEKRERIVNGLMEQAKADADETRKSKTLMSVEMKKQLAAGKIQKLYYVMHNRRMAKTRQALREQMYTCESSKKDIDQKMTELLESRAKLIGQKAELEIERASLNSQKSETRELEKRLKAKAKELVALEEKLRAGEEKLDVRQASIEGRERSVEQWEAILKKRERDEEIHARTNEVERGELLSEQAQFRRKVMALDTKYKQIELDKAASEGHARQLSALMERLNEEEVVLSEREEKVESMEREAQEHRKSILKLENSLKVRKSELEELQAQLSHRDELMSLRAAELQRRERALAMVPEREEALTRREREQEIREADFFDRKAAQITARSSRQIRDLEQQVTMEIRAVDRYKERCEKLENLLKTKDEELERLRSGGSGNGSKRSGDEMKVAGSAGSSAGGENADNVARQVRELEAMREQLRAILASAGGGGGDGTGGGVKLERGAGLRGVQQEWRSSGGEGGIGPRNVTIDLSPSNHRASRRKGAEVRVSLDDEPISLKTYAGGLSFYEGATSSIADILDESSEQEGGRGPMKLADAALIFSTSALEKPKQKRKHRRKEKQHQHQHEKEKQNQNQKHQTNKPRFRFGKSSSSRSLQSQRSFNSSTSTSAAGSERGAEEGSRRASFSRRQPPF